MHIATHAVALGAFTKTLRLPDVQVHAQRAYGNALRQLTRAISDKELVRHDDVLIGVLLLSIYEVRSSPAARNNNSRLI